MLQLFVLSRFLTEKVRTLLLLTTLFLEPL